MLSNRKYIVFFRYVFLEDNKGEDGMKFTGCDLPQTIQGCALVCGRQCMCQVTPAIPE